jgi:hypothetical protein
MCCVTVIFVIVMTGNKKKKDVSNNSPIILIHLVDCEVLFVFARINLKSIFFFYFFLKRTPDAKDLKILTARILEIL